MTRAAVVFAFSAALLAAAPLVPRDGVDRGELPGFKGWPTHLDGRVLTPLPLEEREARIAQTLPGRIARMTDGQREVIYRWIAEPTRAIHGSEECLRGSGYTLGAVTVDGDAKGRRVRRFVATRGDTTLLVSESIEGADGRTFDDVSQWYWSALLGGSVGPWWMVTVSQSVAR